MVALAAIHCAVSVIGAVPAVKALPTAYVVAVPEPDESQLLKANPLRVSVDPDAITNVDPDAIATWVGGIPDPLPAA